MQSTYLIRTTPESIKALEDLGVEYKIETQQRPDGRILTMRFRFSEGVQ